MGKNTGGNFIAVMYEQSHVLNECGFHKVILAFFNDISLMDIL